MFAEGGGNAGLLGRSIVLYLPTNLAPRAPCLRDGNDHFGMPDALLEDVALFKALDSAELQPVFLAFWVT